MDRWHQIESLFQEALQRSSAERDAFLREACRGDSELRREVASLLSNHDQASGFESWAARAAAQLIDAPALLQPGQSLGPYRIESFLAAGGMGEVYRATDTRLHRGVAIKVSAARFSERFDREARVVASLNHPHICQLYDVGPNYLVMELVEGPTLADRIAQGALPMDEALGIARQIAEALEAAHEKGRVHRDLKPANVKITPEGVVKVLDFGLAKAAEEPATVADPNGSPTLTLSATRAGVILGTAAYMSPEQARGAAVDKRADIWAFGCVLYEMLSGKQAFSGETTSDILAAVLKEEPDWSRIPAKVQPLLRRCLAKPAKQRLRDIGDAMPLLDSAPEPVPVRRPWRWLAVSVLVVAAAVGWWRATRAAPLLPLMRVSVELPPGKAISTSRASQLAVSPDGTRIAVTETDPAGKWQLATRRLDESEFVPLSGTNRAVAPTFSPDSRWIAFAAEGKLKKVAVEGGAPVTLCDAPFPTGASWGDDDNLIAGLNLASGLSRIPAAGGAPVPVTVLNSEKGETAHVYPQVLPGSRAVLFTTRFGSYGDANIEVLSFKSGERKTVLRGGSLGRYLPSGHLVYLHENRLFAAPFDLTRMAVTGTPQPVLEDLWVGGLFRSANFDFSQTGIVAYVRSKGAAPQSIFWLDSTGKTQPLFLPPAFYMSPRISPDGKHLAVARRSTPIGSADIWVMDLARGTVSRLTSLAASNHNIVWTPDSRNIVFESWSGPAPGMYWIGADGSGEPQRLTEGKPRRIPSSFSPGGKRLVYSETNARGSAAEIWTAPIEGDPEHPRLGKAERFLGTAFSEFEPALSPDGRWLAYVSTETGTTEVYVRPFPGPGAERPVSSGGGAFPIWSPDGRELFFLALDRRVMVVGYTGNRDSFTAGKPRVWSEKRLVDMPACPYDLARDGKRFAVVLPADGGAQEESKPINSVTILLNFFDELRRRVPAGGR